MPAKKGPLSFYDASGGEEEERMKKLQSVWVGPPKKEGICIQSPSLAPPKDKYQHRARKAKITFRLFSREEAQHGSGSRSDKLSQGDVVVLSDGVEIVYWISAFSAECAANGNGFKEAN